MNWTDWLPNVLQLPVLYWTMAICLGVIHFCRKIPADQHNALEEQGLVFLIAAFVTIPLVPQSFTYAWGTAFICSCIADSVYDTVIALGIKKIKSVFGLPDDTKP